MHTAVAIYARGKPQEVRLHQRTASVPEERTVANRDTVWIPMSDGSRLAARVWLPATGDRPVPAIVECLPYRRRDRHRADDALLHPQFAARGYACVRIDLRGSGDSDGLMSDEYTPQEHADTLEALRWITSQDWCSGSIGMIGLSWSGFHALQVAALAPPELKAVIVACASDDHYGDDMHYRGGCLLNDNLQYGSTLFTYLAPPPDPLVVGEGWRRMWQRRLENTAPPTITWLNHAVEDDYWRYGSVKEQYASVRAPVFLVGGWADGYSNAILRLMENLDCPRKAIIGPWGHAFPHVAAPGPTVDFIAEATRWWDRWLKGHESGITAEPAIRLWLQDHEAPATWTPRRAGHWIQEHGWPSGNIAEHHFALADSGLLPEPTNDRVRWELPRQGVVGLEGGQWCPYGLGAELPGDQRVEDQHSLVFDAERLQAPVDVVGRPSLRLAVTSTAPHGQVAARLCDVAPDGTSVRISYGLVNLCRRRSPAVSEPLRPGEVHEVELPLDHAAYRVPAGHRIRVALSTRYWPIAWPAPTSPVIEVLSGSALTLPVRRGAGPDDAPADEAPRVEGLDREVEIPTHRGLAWRDGAPDDDEITMGMRRDLGRARIADVGLTCTGLGSETYALAPGEPDAPRAEAQRSFDLERRDWRVAIRTHTSLTSTPQAFHLKATLEAFEGDRSVFSNSWDVAIRRDDV